MSKTFTVDRQRFLVGTDSRTGTPYITSITCLNGQIAIDRLQQFRGKRMIAPLAADKVTHVFGSLFPECQAARRAIMWGIMVAQEEVSVLQNFVLFSCHGGSPP